MDRSEDAARQTREMAEAWHRSSAGDANTLARKLSISRDLAEYLVELETRISALESNRLSPPHSRP